ncbi:NAD-dependent epimerase/dehydratase family protein [Amycolatopsis rhabdoformis]|uniref:NAD-dependent epimerase/dehydratase family protein n=1 Tax=Amycolatopsis rhabdoformis TaxID=1448059 RepID=A0ABZ1ICX4_9PSEU|nr:NAD-dependent epimerase/dehydratase family protein [Amycolatopsis rhabdoformis]WSE32310.1 NAD-dependent epimerase/dehydratase family protein [Amycolatopsis rhabdoformis]
MTGGSGFVGQHLVRRVTGEGHAVLALARSDRAAELITAAAGDAVMGDLADLVPGAVRPEWASVLAGCDAVIHAAGRMEFWGPDAGFRRDNFVPAVALHEAAAAAGVGRFVLISSASVSTGSQRAAIVDEDTDNGRPNLAYSRVKLATEQALLSAGTRAMDTVVVRPPFVWGAGMATSTELADLARAGGWKWIDRGSHVMDFIHVGNLVAAAELALTRGRPGGVYYVTDATPMPIRDFMTALLATQGVDVSRAGSVPLRIAAPLAAVLEGGARLLRRPQPPILTRWLISFLGRDRSYDITAARRDLGYAPCVDLAQGLAEMTSPHLG